MLPTYYPPTGFGEIAERVAAEAREAGADIRTGCRVREVHTSETGDSTVVYDCDGAEHELTGSHAVSTLPLHHLIRMLRPAPPEAIVAAAEKLDYRALVALGMVTTKQDILDGAYVYMLNKPYNRISEMNAFSPETSPPGKNILMIEMPVLRDSIAWKASKKELFDISIDALSDDGFLQPGDVEELILVKAPYAYPVYRKDYAPNLKAVLDYIDRQPAVTTLGRLGEFMYMDSDECMKRAFELAESIAGKQKSPPLSPRKTRVD